MSLFIQWAEIWKPLKRHILNRIVVGELLSTERSAVCPERTRTRFPYVDRVCAMRVSSLLAAFRPALPLILGLSLGCSLSLLMVSWTQGDAGDSCGDELGNRVLFPGDHRRDTEGGLDAANEDFQPRIVPYHKDPNKPHKKVLRQVHRASVLCF